MKFEADKTLRCFQDYTVRLQAKFEYAVNAVAFNAQMYFIAISTGVEVRLYENPLQAGALYTPVKIWTRKTRLPNIPSFFKFAFAVGLHFAFRDELVVSYLTGHW